MMMQQFGDTGQSDCDVAIAGTYISTRYDADH